MAEKDLLDAIARLEDKVDRLESSSNIAWLQALGLGLIVAAPGLIQIDNPAVAAFLYVAGGIIFFSSVFYKPLTKRKSNKGPGE